MKQCTIDKYGIILETGSFDYIKKPKLYNPHISYEWKFGNLNISVSSKVVQEYNKLGCISPNNIEQHPELIFEATGYKFTLETLLNANLFWLDMKTDLENTTGYSNKEVISVLREKSYTSTSRNETPSYDKDKGFENSILIKSTSMKVNDSICEYDKIKEIRSNKHRFTDYYNNFSETYLDKNNKILRFERRLQSTKDIKKAFKICKRNITLLDIFNSDVDVVAEKVRKIFM